MLKSHRNVGNVKKVKNKQTKVQQAEPRKGWIWHNLCFSKLQWSCVSLGLATHRSPARYPSKKSNCICEMMWLCMVKKCGDKTRLHSSLLLKATCGVFDWLGCYQAVFWWDGSLFCLCRSRKLTDSSVHDLELYACLPPPRITQLYKAKSRTTN